MQKIISERLETPVAGEYDVIVAGGGPAGACAAIAAARAGARTLVIEQQLYLGGMWTGGLVNPLFDLKQKGGLLAELIAEHRRLGSFGGFINACFGYENMKRLLEEKLFGAGGEALYQTRFCRPLAEGGRVQGVTVENRDGRAAYLARVIVDCTGDAEVAARLGLPTRTGRPEDGLCQAMTLMFTIGNVDFMQDTCHDLRRMIEQAAQEAGDGYRLPYSRPYIIQIPNSKTAVVQLTHMRGYDPLSAADVGRAAAEGRRQAYEAVEFLRRHVARFREIELLETAPLLGIRESRRIVGEYTLTREDLGAGRRFPDDITTAAFGVDIHNPLDDSQQCYPVQRYGIPYRALIPRGAEGLLVAGRCISGTHEAMASYRVTGDCAAMGEAAGIAAALAARTGRGVREIGAEEIRERMK